MDPELLARAEAIFHEIVGMSPDQQVLYLDRKCPGDHALRALLDSLLAYDEDENGVFSHPNSIPETPALAPVLAADTWIGRYQLIRSLGRGGMGQVYLARQEKPARDVALKILRFDLSDQSLSERFKQEVEILGRLNHPGIAQIYESGTSEDGHSFFAMEFSPGLSLGEFVRTENLDLREKLDLAIQLCEAVQHAHGRGVIHRDLKPSNIMATRQDEGGIQTRILDFGVARITSPDGILATRYTIPGQLVGTLAYMSPEQIAGNSEDLDARSDIFQLGVIIYELLAGKLPLDIGTSGFAETMRVISNEEPLLLGTLDKAFHGDIEIIVNKALAKDRDERYGSAGELATDLRHHLEGEPILARETRFFDRFLKTLKRRRKFVSGFAVVVLVGWLFVTLQIWQEPLVSHNALRLTRLLGTEDGHFPGYSLSLSPNGEQLAFSQAGDVVFRDMESDQAVVRVPKIPEKRWAHGVSWFPSGKEILIEFNTANNGFQLVRFDLFSEEEQVIHVYEGDARPLVSPDGKRVLLVREKESELAVLELQSGVLSTVVTVGEGESLSCAVWGPDSQHIAFERILEPGYYLECVDLAGHRSVLLEDGSLFPQPWLPTVAWLPDGRLLYNRFRDFTYTGTDLMFLPMDVENGQAMGKPVLIYSLENRAMRDLTYSAVTNSLVFSANLRDHALVQFDLTRDLPLKAEVLSVRGWPCNPIGWASDGLSLLMSEANSKYMTEILIWDKVLGEARPVGCCPENAKPLGLFPGDKYLLMLDETKVVAVPLDCGPIIDLGFEFQVVPRKIELISPRGDTGINYLMILEGSKLLLHEVTLENGVAKEFKIIHLDLDGIYAQHNAWGHLSPDGKSIAFVEFKSEVKLYDIATGSITVIPTDLGTIQEMRWSWDGNWIYCQGLDGKEHPRWMGRIDPKTGQSEEIWISDRAKIIRPYPAPDGQTLMARRTIHGAELFMLEGL